MHAGEGTLASLSCASENSHGHDPQRSLHARGSKSRQQSICVHIPTIWVKITHVKGDFHHKDDLHARGPAIAPSAYFALAFEYFGTVGTAGYPLNYLHSVAHFS